MPVGASLVKERATRGYGATVRIEGTTVDDAVRAATAYADQTGAVLVHPFDHPDVVAGQGSVGLEVAEQVPDVATVLVCTGGGGLLAGVACALQESTDVRVVGVQAEGAAAYPPSLWAGHPVPLGSMSTMADGIAVGCPGAVPFALVRALVDEIITVDEDAISRALLRLLERNKLLAEPAGAVAVAALMAHPGAFRPPVVVTVSGGNVDPLLLARLVRHGLVADGRFASFRVTIPDRPGALAALLAALASTGANVLDVVHERTGASLHVDEVEVRLVVETRGPDHRDEVLTAVAAADTGWRLSVQT
jgi:threonine dehydratase